MKAFDWMKWELSGSTSEDTLLSVKIVRREQRGGSVLYSERRYQRTGPAAERGLDRLKSARRE